MSSIARGGRYCKYLRKSRADELREAMGEMETLAKHDKALDELASRLGIEVSCTYREIVSGESIQDRPEMQKLLAAVRSGEWDGVLTMEVERLSRGDSTDQGIVGKAFLFSDTLIITPMKVYDPRSESDMEYFEFGLFMSRREYKAINKRLVNGRIASVREGQFIGKTAPYGYRKAVIDKMKTLVPDEATAPILKEIFDLYEGGMTMRQIARRFSRMGIPAPGGQDEWVCTSLSKMLRNDVYIGKVHWRRYVYKTTLADDNVTVVKQSVPNSAPLIYDGLHEPLVTLEQFERVQMALKDNKAPKKDGTVLKTHYSRVLVCAKCGHGLRYDEHRANPYLVHRNSDFCRTRSTTLAKVDDAVVSALRDMVSDFEVELSDPSRSLRAKRFEADTKRLTAAIEAAKKSLGDNYDRLERGILSETEFVDRREVLNRRIDEATAELESLEAPDTSDLDQKISNLKELIAALRDKNVSGMSKNKLLKSIVRRIEYRNGEPGSPDQMQLEIFLK